VGNGNVAQGGMNEREKMEIKNLFGFIVEGNIVAMVSDDAIIDAHQGKIVDSIVASLSEFIDNKKDFTILHYSPIAIGSNIPF
jgi:hypothetical protein